MNETTAYRIPERFFAASLAEADPELAASIGQELGRQQDGIELIASENIVSRAVLEAQGSVLTNKYAEGYPGRRYYGGCEYVDMAETLAIERATKLFGCGFANVQPHTGAQANGGLSRPAASGQTPAWASTGRRRPPDARRAADLSGKWCTPVPCTVRPRGPADRHRGGRAARAGAQAENHRRRRFRVPPGHGFRAFRAIADRVGACFMVDMAHFAGLVAGGAHP